MLPMNFKEHQLYTEFQGRKKPASSYLAGCDPSRPSFHPQRATATRPRSWYFTRLPFLGEQSLDCICHAWTWIKETLRCSSKELCCECFGLLSWSWSLQAFGRRFGSRNQSCPFLRNEHDENAALKPWSLVDIARRSWMSWKCMACAQDAPSRAFGQSDAQYCDIFQLQKEMMFSSQGGSCSHGSSQLRSFGWRSK